MVRDAAWLGARLLASALVTFASPAAAEFRRIVTVREISTDTLPPASGSEPDTQAEPHVAVDPNDPSVVVAVFQQGRFPDGGSVDPGFATSHDGGRTWAAGDLPGLTVAAGGEFERATDPVVAIGADGAVYAQTLALSFQADRDAVAVQRSDDHGLTFGPPFLVQEDQPCCQADKNWLAVDSSPTSPYFGRLYSAWVRIFSGAQVVLRYSDDRGATWSGLGTLVDRVETQDPIPLVQPNGDLTIVYIARRQADDPEPTPTRVVAQTSRDGGSTFEQWLVIDTLQAIEPTQGVRSGGLPAAAIDPVTGTLYAVWQDGRNRSDGLNDIVLSVGTDGGRTWTPARRVHPPDTRRLYDRFTPAVAAYGGYVHVTYRRRLVAGGVPSDFVENRYSVSADGGLSFASERRLGRRGDFDFAAVTTRGLFLGDYAGLAASPDAVHAVWCLPRPLLSAEYHQTTWGATILR
jgi:hypothetical protein